MIITLAGRGGGKVESSILMWPLLKPLLNRDGQHRISLPISLIYICSDMNQLKGTWLPNSVQVILWRAFMFCVTVLKSIKQPTERCILHYYGFQVRKKTWNICLFQGFIYCTRECYCVIFWIDKGNFTCLKVQLLEAKILNLTIFYQHMWPFRITSVHISLEYIMHLKSLENMPVLNLVSQDVAYWIISWKTTGTIFIEVLHVFIICVHTVWHILSHLCLLLVEGRRRLQLNSRMFYGLFSRRKNTNR